MTLELLIISIGLNFLQLASNIRQRNTNRDERERFAKYISKLDKRIARLEADLRTRASDNTSRKHSKSF